MPGIHLETRQKRCTIIGKITKMLPDIILTHDKIEKKIILSLPVSFSCGSWLRLFGIDKNDIFLVEAYHIVDPNDLPFYVLFRKRVSQFKRQNKREEKKT